MPLIQCKSCTFNGKKLKLRELPSFTLGSPKKESKSAIAGEGIYFIYHKEDHTEVVSTLTLPLFADDENISDFSKWKHILTNSCFLADDANGASFKFEQLAIQEDPKIDTQSNELEIVCKGQPVLTQN